MQESETRIEGIKDYIETLFGAEDPDLKWVRQNCIDNHLPMINVPPHVGKLLYILTKIKSPKRVLEIGTLGGYSTLWLAKALKKEAKIVSIDLEEHHLKLAKMHADHCQLSHKIEFIKGHAIEILDQMIIENHEKFDLIFIDADKENYMNYLTKVQKLANEEALILSDNLIPKWKAIGKPHPKDEMAKSIYAFNESLVLDPNLDSAIISTLVGEIPRIDGLGISIFRSIKEDKIL